jgi:hypothetical protein
VDLPWLDAKEQREESGDHQALNVVCIAVVDGYGAHHGYHGAYGMPGHYGHGGYGRASMISYVQHPVLGDPVPMAYGHRCGKPHGKGGFCDSYQKSGYFMKTGMHAAEKTAAAAPAGDIVDVAVGAGSFSTLAEAVKAAGHRPCFF